MKKFAKIAALVMVAVMSLALLVACAPNGDPDKAAAALKKNEYTGGKDSTVIPAALTLLGVKGVDCAVSGSKIVEDKDGNKKGESVTIVYFVNADSANSAWDKVKGYAEDKKDKDESDWTIEKSGKMIYWGTKAGIKAAR